MKTSAKKTSADFDALVKKFGTPLYVYSRHTIEDHFRKLDRALAAAQKKDA